MSSRFRAGLIGATTIITLLGCKKDRANTDRASSASADSGPGVQGPGNGSPGTGVSDANIFYLLDAPNVGDSANGALASTKGTSGEIRDFGKMMMRDHHALRQQNQELAKRLGIQPAPPAGDSMGGKLTRQASRLQAASKGRDFDKAYIDQEVGIHRDVLSIAITAMRATQNSEIKNLIQKAAPVVQAHLDKAEIIQKNLLK